MQGRQGFFFAPLVALLVSLVTGANAAVELQPMQVLRVETNETTFDATFTHKTNGLAYIIMQPCFGRKLNLCLYPLSSLRRAPAYA